jgi:hypothetical protein
MAYDYAWEGWEIYTGSMVEALYYKAEGHGF